MRMLLLAVIVAATLSGSAYADYDELYQLKISMTDVYENLPLTAPNASTCLQVFGVPSSDDVQRLQADTDELKTLLNDPRAAAAQQDLIEQNSAKNDLIDRDIAKRGPAANQLCVNESQVLSTVLRLVERDIGSLRDAIAKAKVDDKK